MLEWIESTGKSEEAAIEAALQKLGMDRDEVSVEILERAKSGFLGIGSCPAKVKVSYEAPDEPEERPTPAEVTPAEAELVKAAGEGASSRTAGSAALTSSASAGVTSAGVGRSSGSSGAS